MLSFSYFTGGSFLLFKAKLASEFQEPKFSSLSKRCSWVSVACHVVWEDKKSLVPLPFILRSKHACRYLADWVSLLKATVQKACLAAKLSVTAFGGFATFREPQDLG